MPHTHRVLPNGVKQSSWSLLWIEKWSLTSIRWVTLGAKSALCSLCSQANPPIDRDGKVPLGDGVFHCGDSSRCLVLIYNLRHAPARNPWDILLAGLSWIIQTLHILRFMYHPGDNKYTALLSYCFAHEESAVHGLVPCPAVLCVRNLSCRTETSWMLRHPGTGQSPVILVSLCPPELWVGMEKALIDWRE